MEEAMQVVTTDMSASEPTASAEEAPSSNELALTIGLRDELEEQRFVDAVLHCRHDALVFTHRIVLAGLSPVLKAALKADEKNEVDTHAHLFIPDAEADELKDVLNNVYVGGFEPAAIPQSLLYLGIGWPVLFDGPKSEESEDSGDQNVIHDDHEEDNSDAPNIRLRSKPATVEERENRLLAERRFYASKKRPGDGKVRQVRTRAGSHVWKFFTLDKENKVARCNICLKEFNMTHVSTSNLARHLRSHHPEAYQKFERLNYGEDEAAVGLEQVKEGEEVAKKPLQAVAKLEPLEESEENVEQMDVTNDESEAANEASEIGDDIVKIAVRKTEIDVSEEQLGSVVTNNGHYVASKGISKTDIVEEIRESDASQTTGENSSVDPLGSADDSFNTSSQERRSRSIVWSYFDCPTKNVAVCNLCGKSFNLLSSSTTNLLRHLKSKHPELREILERDNQEKKELKRINAEYNESTNGTSSHFGEKRAPYVTFEEVSYTKVSPIWVHFQQLDVDKVQCQHCDQVFKMAKGSTSTALRHLRKKHPDKENEVKEQVFSEGYTKSDYLLIWKYFDEDKANKTAVCKICRMPIYIGGNYSEEGDDIGPLRFLVDHLKHTHVEDHATFEDEMNTNKLVRGRVRVLSTRNFRPRAPVWSYFDYVEEKNGADCKACLKTVNMVNKKATSNLYKHLKQTHVKLYEQLLRESGRTEEEIQDMIENEPKKRGPKPGPKPKDKETEMSRTCSKCGKIFTRYKGLLAHMRCVHSDRKPYSCDTCGLTFAWRDSWKRHMITHTNIKPYLCSLCGKTFMKRSVRDNHERIHMGERRFVCQTCGKHFTTKQRMELHQRIHTGEKPFMCEYDGCGKRFHEKHHLVTHRRVHTGEKPYSCEVCHQSFKYISAKSKHNCPGLAEHNTDQTTAANIFNGQRFEIYEDEAHNATIAIMAE